MAKFRFLIFLPLIATSSFAASGIYGKKIFLSCPGEITYQESHYLRKYEETVPGNDRIVRFECEKGANMAERFSVVVLNPKSNYQQRYNCKNHLIGYVSDEKFVYNCVKEFKLPVDEKFGVDLAAITTEKYEYFSSDHSIRPFLVRAFYDFLLGKPPEDSTGDWLSDRKKTYPAKGSFFISECVPGKCGWPLKSDAKKSYSFFAKYYFHMAPRLCDYPTPELPSIWNLKAWGWSERVHNPRYRQSNLEEYTTAAWNARYVSQVQYIFGLGDYSSDDKRKEHSSSFGGFVNLKDEFLDTVDKNPNMSFECAHVKASYEFEKQMASLVRQGAFVPFLQSYSDRKVCMAKIKKAAERLKFSEPCNFTGDPDSRLYVLFE